MPKNQKTNVKEGKGVDVNMPGRYMNIFLPWGDSNDISS